MGHDCNRKVDVQGSMEQMGDYVGAGPASQNTDHIYMDYELPHLRRRGTQGGRRLVKGQDGIVEDTKKTSSDECGCFPMRGSLTKMGQTSRWDL